MKIEKIKISRLRNEEFFQFHSEFKKLINREGAKNLKIETQFNAYLAGFDNMDESLKKISKSALTEKIVEADRARDEIWYGLLDMHRAASRHFDTKVRDAAENLKILLDTYGGSKLAVKSFDAQTAAITNILQEFKGKYSEYVKNAALEQWVEELEAKNKAFESIVKERDDESAAKNTFVAKETRAELTDVYNAIAERIDAFALIEADLTVFETFIKEWNAVVVRYKNALNRRKSPEKEETLPVSGDKV